MSQANGILTQLRPSAEQAPAVYARGHDVAVVAGAGSGKTRTLVSRYLSLLEDGIALRRIVAITFTNKAAREMRNRVRSRISAHLRRDLDQEQERFWQERLASMDSARISTIHSLCTDILRAHPAEAQIDPQFDVLAEGERGLLLKRITEETLAWAVNEPELVPLFAALGAGTLQGIIASCFGKRLDLGKHLGQEDLAARWRAAELAWLDEQFTALTLTSRSTTVPSLLKIIGF